jgi:hypothetical protein
LPKGPLAILKESCTRECDLRVECDKPVNEYLIDLKQKLMIARDYADEHSKREQQRYVSHYNLSSQDKHFTVGESALLLLLPNSTSSKVFSKWRGPAKNVEIKSPYSYIVELADGRRQHFHANRLRKYNLKVDEVECTSVGLSSFILDNADCSCSR